MQVTKISTIFPVLSDPQGFYFPKILEALNVESRFIEEFTYEIENEGRILIPRLENFKGDERRVFPLLSTRTTSPGFFLLTGASRTDCRSHKSRPIASRQRVTAGRAVKESRYHQTNGRAPRRNFQTADQLLVTASL